jgi:hypothetical protein
MPFWETLPGLSPPNIGLTHGRTKNYAMAEMSVTIDDHETHTKTSIIKAGQAGTAIYGTKNNFQI